MRKRVLKKWCRKNTFRRNFAGTLDWRYIQLFGAVKQRGSTPPRAISGRGLGKTRVGAPRSRAMAW
jgi:hypothetical protein